MGRGKLYESSSNSNAVMLILELENISELACELGIETVLIYQWRREYAKLDEGCFSANGKPKLSPEENELIELK